MGRQFFPRRGPARALSLLVATGALLYAAAACDDDAISVLPEPEIQVDELTQRAAALVDILWVIDNSQSMVQEQQALAENFERFIGGLTLCQGTGVEGDLCDFESKTCLASGEACNPPDYHIGVVSTDLLTESDQGRLRGVGLCAPATGVPPAGDRYRYCRGSNADCAHDPSDPSSSPDNATCDLGQPLRFVTATTPNARDAFSKLIQVGVTSSAFETGIQAAARALGLDVDRGTGMTVPAPEENAGFLRPDASLFVIFVSDEDDNSTGEISYFYRVFETLKGAGNEGLVSLSAIVGEPDIDGQGGNQGGCVPAGAPMDERNAPGTRYVALSMYSRGLSVDFRVCDRTRLTCPGDEVCQSPVPDLPGICVPNIACGEDRACGNLQCGDRGCVSCDDGACQATKERFLQLLERNGVFGSICADYDQLLDSLGFEAAGLARKFELTRFPDCRATPVPCCADDVPPEQCTATARLCVKVDGEVIPNDRAAGWIYESTTNAVFFDGSFVPATSASVSLTYRRSDFEEQAGCDVELQ